MMPRHRRILPRPESGVLRSAIALLLLVSALVAGRAASGSEPSLLAESAAPQARPNVVVIMADDMRHDDLRWMPNTRRLIAAAGARFTNSFAPYPLCCPARASFLTGQYTQNNGVWSNKPPFAFASLDDTDTLPVWLENAGYNPLFLGKYLNGYGGQPLADGSSSVQYVPPGWTDWRASANGMPASHPMDGGTYRYFDMTLNINGQLEGHQGTYSTRLLGDQSVDLIRRYAPSERPFFLWANYVAPHDGGPREVDDPARIRLNDGSITNIRTPAVQARYKGRFDAEITKAPGLPAEADVSDKPSFIRSLPPINQAERLAMREAARQRAEALAILDEEVAHTIDALRQAGELGNTVVMFTSDNGYFQGEHRMRQGKTLPYEPSLRTPLLIRGPGIPAGVTRSTPFLTIDFAPTILDVANTAPPTSIDGESLLAATKSGGSAWDRPVLTLTGPQKTVAKANDAGTPLEVEPVAAPAVPYTVGVRTQQYLYVEHLSGETELYDMRNDPEQLDNLAGLGRYASIQRRLATILDDLRACSGSDCRRPLSSW
jgi:arylsulfatase A-like enzyme